MAVGHFLVVIDGNLAHAAGYAYAQASGGVVAAQQDIGQGGAAFASGIPEGEEGVGMFIGPFLVQGTAFDIHHHQGFAGGFEFLQELGLEAHQVQGAAVEAFAGLHVGNGALVHQGGAGVNVFGAEIPGR